MREQRGRREPDQHGGVDGRATRHRPAIRGSGPERRQLDRVHLRRRLHGGNPNREVDGPQHTCGHLHEWRPSRDGSRVSGSDYCTRLVRDVPRKVGHENRGRPGRVSRILATERLDELRRLAWPCEHRRDYRDACGQCGRWRDGRHRRRRVRGGPRNLPGRSEHGWRFHMDGCTLYSRPGRALTWVLWTFNWTTPRGRSIRIVGRGYGPGGVVSKSTTFSPFANGTSG